MVTILFRGEPRMVHVQLFVYTGEQIDERIVTEIERFTQHSEFSNLFWTRVSGSALGVNMRKLRWFSKKGFTIEEDHISKQDTDLILGEAQGFEFGDQFITHLLLNGFSCSHV